MDVPTLMTQIKRQFGDEYSVIITDDDIYGYIYEAELDIIRNTGLNTITQTASSSTFPLALPTTVSIKRVTVNGVAMVYTTTQEMDMLGLDYSVTGAPSYYYIDLQKLYLYPAANPVVQVSVTYSKTPVLMVGTPASQSFTVADVYHTDILKFCRGKAHNKNQNFQAEKVEMDAYNEAIGVRREEANSVDNIIVKINDPWDYE